MLKHAVTVLHCAPLMQELIVDPKQLGTPGGLTAAPGSEPSPLLLNGAGAGGSRAGALEGQLQRVAISHDDHPLSLGDNSRWKAYFKVFVCPWWWWLGVRWWVGGCCLVGREGRKDRVCRYPRCRQAGQVSAALRSRAAWLWCTHPMYCSLPARAVSAL